MKNSAAAGIGITVIIAVVIGVYALGSQDVAEDSSTNTEKLVTVEDRVGVSSSEEDAPRTIKVSVEDGVGVSGSEEEVEVAESSEEDAPRTIKVSVEDGVGVSSP